MNIKMIAKIMHVTGLNQYKIHTDNKPRFFSLTDPFYGVVYKEEISNTNPNFSEIINASFKVGDIIEIEQVTHYGKVILNCVKKLLIK
jgi:hypothetical protein